MQGEAGGSWSYASRNLHYGVREHAMGALMNGLAAHGGVRSFGATFLVFSDYMRPAIRLATLMELPVIYVFTHDPGGSGIGDWCAGNSPHPGLIPELPTRILTSPRVYSLMLISILGLRVIKREANKYGHPHMPVLLTGHRN